MVLGEVFDEFDNLPFVDVKGEEVEAIVTGAPIDLAPGSTIGGASIPSATDLAAAATPTVVALAPWGPANEPCVA